MLDYTVFPSETPDTETDSTNTCPMPNPCPPPAKPGYFHPPKPTFTMQEEFIRTMKRVEDTLHRVICLEHDVKRTMDDYMKTLSADNVAFKDLCMETYNQFSRSVTDEVNLFESQMTNSYEVFCQSVNSNWDAFVLNYDAFEKEINDKIDDFRDEMEKRINAYYKTLEDSFKAYRESVDTTIATHKENLDSSYATFTANINSVINKFMNDWTAEIDARLDGQDAKIADAETFMKTNLRPTVIETLDSWKSSGYFDSAIQQVVVADAVKPRVYVFNTFADAQASSGIPENSMIKTLGYYSVGDGGGALYRDGTNDGLRPNKYTIDNQDGMYFTLAPENNIINPVMFGYHNTNDWDDYLGCHRSFYDMSQFLVSQSGKWIIDGLGKTYKHSVPVATDPYGLDGFHCGIMELQGYVSVELKNFKFEMTYASRPGSFGFPCLTAYLSSSTSYYIHDCSFKGNYGDVQYSTGREDGGNHGIAFVFADGTFPNDYKPSGDIRVENCTFEGLDSYGIFMSPCECTLTVDNCHFDIHGPAITPYATNSIIKNCTGEINSSYKTMTLNFCHDEMEFGETYTGNKYKSLRMENCVVKCGVLYKIHSASGELKYDKIIIKDCENTRVSESAFTEASGGILCVYTPNARSSEFAYLDLTGATNIEYIRVEKCKNTIGKNHNSGVYDLGLSGCIVQNCYLDKKELLCEVFIDDTYIKDFTVDDAEFTRASFIQVTNSEINTFTLNDCKANLPDASYVAITSQYETDGKFPAVINNFYINNYRGISHGRQFYIDIINMNVNGMYVESEKDSNNIELFYLPCLGSSSDKRLFIFNNVTALCEFTNYNYFINVGGNNVEGDIYITNSSFANTVDIFSRMMTVHKLNVAEPTT